MELWWTNTDREKPKY